MKPFYQFLFPWRLRLKTIYFFTIFLCTYNMTQASPILSILSHDDASPSGPLRFYDNDIGPYGDNCWGEKQKVNHQQSLAKQYRDKLDRFKEAGSCYNDRTEDFEEKVEFHEGTIERLREKQESYKQAIERLDEGGDVDLADLQTRDLRMCTRINRRCKKSQ